MKFATASFKGNKQSLPRKPCVVCGRIMTWRKRWARIAAVRPAAYARTRNAHDDAVMGLSLFITHGFVTFFDVLAIIEVPAW